MKNIPKTAYFYWGAEIFPYLRYMSLYSFKKFNPEWEVTLLVPSKLNKTQTWNTHENKCEINTEDYLHRLDECGIDVCEFDMQSIGFSNDLPEVIKSDIIRLSASVILMA